MYITQYDEENPRHNIKQLLELYENGFDKSCYSITTQKGKYIFIGIRKNKIIATYTVIIDKKAWGWVAHLEDFVVHRDYRGKGHGKMMIDFVHEFCVNMGCYKVIHSCPNDLVPYYEKNADMKVWQTSMRRDLL